MEILIWVVLVALVVGGIAIYRKDPEGFKAIGQRTKRIVRAQVQSKQKPELSVIEILPEDKAQEVWTAEFTEDRHRIVKTDYYESSKGPWPQWHCKCGESGFRAVYGNLEIAQNLAKVDGQAHVREMNKAEKAKETNGGDFAF